MNRMLVDRMFCCHQMLVNTWTVSYSGLKNPVRLGSVTKMMEQSAAVTFCTCNVALYSPAEYVQS